MDTATLKRNCEQGNSFFDTAKGKFQGDIQFSILDSVRHQSVWERFNDRRKGTFARILVPPPKMLHDVTLPSGDEVLMHIPLKFSFHCTKKGTTLFAVPFEGI